MQRVAKYVEVFKARDVGITKRSGIGQYVKCVIIIIILLLIPGLA